jgi:hypothetical protein
MAKNIFLMTLILLAALVSGGGCNIFGDMADKTSDDAIIAEINNLIDAGLWNDAILKWNLLSSSAQAKRENKLLRASAYAGRGGLDILRIISNINTGGANFFTILMKAFRTSQDRHISDEITAESIIVSISPSSSLRTIDENVFLLFVEFAKIGTTLAFYADADADQVVDASFDNCTATYNSLHLKHLLSGIANIIDIIATIGTSLGGTPLKNLNSACSSLGVPGICAKTDASTVTPAEELVVKTLIGESHLAVGLGVSNSVDTREFTTPVTAHGDPCAGVAPCICP